MVASNPTKRNSQLGRQEGNQRRGEIGILSPRDDQAGGSMENQSPPQINRHLKAQNSQTS